MNTTIEASPQTVLKEGENVSIYCKSDRVLVEHVTLKRMVDDGETDLKTSAGAEISFTLDSVKLSDSGFYVCEAVNEYGRQRANLSMSVKGKTLKFQPACKISL